MCGSSNHPRTMSGPLPRFAARAAFGRTSSQVMYSTFTATPVASVNFFVLAFQTSSSDFTNPDQRNRRSVAPFSILWAGSYLPDGACAYVRKTRAPPPRGAGAGPVRAAVGGDTARWGGSPDRRELTVSVRDALRARRPCRR